MFPIPLNPRLIGLAVGAVLVACALLYVRHLRNANEELTVERDAARQQVQLQNLAINKMAEESEQLKEAGKLLVEQAKKETAPIKEQAKEILKAQPSNKNDMCQSALDLINGVSK